MTTQLEKIGSKRFICPLLKSSKADTRLKHRLVECAALARLIKEGGETIIMSAEKVVKKFLDTFQEDTEVGELVKECNADFESLGADKLNAFLNNLNRTFVAHCPKLNKAARKSFRKQFQSLVAMLGYERDWSDKDIFSLKSGDSESADGGSADESAVSHSTKKRDASGSKKKTKNGESRSKRKRPAEETSQEDDSPKKSCTENILMEQIDALKREVELLKSNQLDLKATNDDVTNLIVGEMEKLAEKQDRTQENLLKINREVSRVAPLVQKLIETTGMKLTDKVHVVRKSKEKGAHLAEKRNVKVEVKHESSSEDDDEVEVVE